MYEYTSEIGRVEFYQLRLNVQEGFERYVRCCSKNKQHLCLGAVVMHEYAPDCEQYGLAGFLKEEESVQARDTARQIIVQLCINATYESSRQFTLAKQTEFGAGFRVPKHRKLSIAGVPWNIGEACLLFALRKMELVDETFVARILSISGNRLYTRISKEHVASTA